MSLEPGDAVLIVDVQVDFCPGGALAVADGDAVIPPLNRIAERAAASGLPVYASRDWHPIDSTHFVTHGGTWPVHCVAGSPGARLAPALQLPRTIQIVTKGDARDSAGYSAFEGRVAGRGALADDLRARGVTRLIVGGLATDYCVRASVLDARREGFDVAVVSDAVRAVNLDPDDGGRALQEMRASGAQVIDSAAILKT